MKRIYFDSNVFSNLRRNERPEYIELNKLLNQYQHNLSFFFSDAHIRDKKKDTTNKKYQDFDFMESFTQDNYLSYDSENKHPNFYLATPRMVFEDAGLTDLSEVSILDFLEPQEDEDSTITSIKTILKESLFSTPSNIDLNLDAIENPEQRFNIEKLFPDINQMKTLGGMMEQLSHITSKIYTDHKSYKELRKMIDTGVNQGKISLESNKISFNDALKNTIIQKTFRDFLQTSITKDKDGHIEFYNYYLNAYNALDFLGIKKDDITKKNNYLNLFNDGIHSYYARYCDYLVTEDADLNPKSKALYTLFGEKTIVVNVQEFIEALPVIGADNEKDLYGFTSNLQEDITNTPRAESKAYGNFIISPILIDRSYMNTFDGLLELMVEDEKHYYLVELQGNYLSKCNFREVGMVVDKLISLFGIDRKKVGRFVWESELSALKEKTWDGRYWVFENLIFHLHHNETFHSLCLSIRRISDRYILP